MALIQGFIEGSIVWDRGTNDYVMLPFQDRTEEANFNYTGELIFSETFGGSNGIKAASAACLSNTEAMFTLNTTNLSWSMLQASVGFRDQARSLPIPVTESFVLTDLDGGGTNSELTLNATPSTGEPIVVADLEGTQYTVAAVGSTLTFSSDFTGTKVTVNYKRDPSTTPERSIEIGSGERVKESGVYGRFVGCGDTYLVIANRAVVVPQLDFGVDGSNPASAGLELKCLRDINGTLATIVQLPEGGI